MRKKFFLAFCSGFFFIWAVLLCTPLIPSAFAQTADDLQQQIDQHNTAIQQLQQEIQQYQTQLNQTSVQAKSLQSAIDSLNLNSKKLQANIAVTQNQIDATNLKIQQLSLGIGDKQSRINTSQAGLAQNIQTLNELDSASLFEVLLVYPNLSTFLNEVDTLQTVQSNVKNHLDDLKDLKKGLEDNKTQSEDEKANLVKLQSDLNSQEISVELNKKQQAQLLAQTKDKESNYQKLITDRKAKEKAFEDELTQYEAQLKLIKNPNTIPQGQPGILSWPLTPHRITQYFGNTEFAAAHSQLYNGQGHNGIDIAASIGTPIGSALSGVVMGTGDTDTACPGASFGKWVLIQHNNGLSTLYAHLSLIKATAGEQVQTGDIIGYSGMTGYATGPHLHFTVYATQGVQIMSRKSVSCSGATYTMPIADLRAYLNPLSFLPN